ncbi:hypothetical protein SteCoe_14724 [Stentor coeruleus]|uniref:MutL C-terminal dimerisation domain-containing protein n=1 Tax=Stentor coeruleus TaxID=5963 RepID=A0A1R2C579_9CILI|nr:hypothetical protein SteCoe_14724 [Stentor coeruleus]
MEIKPLDDITQNLIKAASRFPSYEYIVGELLENALRALADYIEIVVGGNEVSVRDNGKGIPFEVLSSFVVGTIAGNLNILKALTEISICSRTKIGEFKAKSHLLAKSSYLTKPGTVITLRNFYNNVPARVKNIEKRDLTSLFSVIEALILPYPNCTVKIFYKNEQVAIYPSVKSIKNRIEDTFNVKSSQFVQFIGEILSISGYLSVFSECLLHEKYQFLYFEGRLIQCENILMRINSIYAEALSLLFKNEKSSLSRTKRPRFPLIILFFERKSRDQALEESSENVMNMLREVTVMIKEQVFKGSFTSVVCDKYLSINSTVKRLKCEWQPAKTHTFSSILDDNEAVRLLETNTSIAKTTKKSIQSIPSYSYKNFPSSSIKQTTEILLPKTLQNFSNIDVSDSLNIDKIKESTSVIEIQKLQVSRVLGQVDNKFIIGIINAHNKEIVTIFDQHATHERIQLEKLEKTLNQDLSSENCRILLRLTSYDYEIMQKKKQDLEKYNFVVKEEGKNLFLIKLPVLYECALTFGDFLTAVHGNSKIPGPIINAVKSRACRTAVKFGDSLSLEQARNICKELENCQLFNKCAHGRPTFYPLAMDLPSFSLPKPRFCLFKNKKK